MSTSRELPVSALYRSCDPQQLDFETTNDLPDPDHLVAQWPRPIVIRHRGADEEEAFRR